MKRTLLSTLVLGLLANLSYAAEPFKAAAAITAAATSASAKSALMSGIETQHGDEAVRAQDDFFRHVNGKWLKTTEIPADRAVWGSFHKLRDDSQTHAHAIIEAAAQAGKAAGPDSQKIGDLYVSFMDQEKRDKLGLTPLGGELAKVDALKDKKEIPGLIAHFNHINVAAPYDFGIGQDKKESTKYAATLYQSGLGMPDRDYYVKLDDVKMADTRAKYLIHVTKMLTLADHKDAQSEARKIVALETELAKLQWTRVENRNPVKTYNKVGVAKLGELTPGYDWQAYLKASGLSGKTDYLIVGQPSYFKGFGEVLQNNPLDVWKMYFEFRLLESYASYLSQAFVDERFAFNGTVLSGAEKDKPRWKHAVEGIEAVLGASIGKLYVEKHFPAERKARIEALVKNLLAAYKNSIDGLDWMSPATRKEAQAKLAKFTPKIGYPNKWRDYSALKISKDDLVGNMMRGAQETNAYHINKLGKPIDREEWYMTPQTVNAYYVREMNEIVFPAAILQPPFFDAQADDAVNYGAIGTVIGHEISHGFDDAGSQYDGDGNLRDWWSKEDREKFAVKGKAMVAQYGAYSPINGYKVNGELTLGENIADNSGLAIAYKAYRISLGGKAAPVIDGLSGDQRLFMGFGQIWRGKARDQEAINRIKTDNHSPDEFRTNGTLRNQPGFYEAFGVKEGDKMYLPPEQRITIW